MKREDGQSDDKKRERERETSSFRWFCRCFAPIVPLLLLDEPRRIIFYFASFRNSSDASIVGARQKERKRERERERDSPRGLTARSFRRGEDSLTDNAILSSDVLLLKMISRHGNRPRAEAFWTPVEAMRLDLANSLRIRITLGNAWRMTRRFRWLIIVIYFSASFFFQIEFRRVWVDRSWNW